MQRTSHCCPFLNSASRHLGYDIANIIHGFKPMKINTTFTVRKKNELILKSDAIENYWAKHAKHNYISGNIYINMQLA